MRRTPAVALLASFVLFVPAPATAQPAKRLTITDFRVGFQAGLVPGDTGKQYLHKHLFWAPVSVDIIAGDKGLNNAELIVETSDSGGIQNTFTVPLPNLSRNQAYTAMTYVKVGGIYGELQVRVAGSDDQYASHRKDIGTMNLDERLFLAVGASQTGLRQLLLEERKKLNQESKDGVALLDNVNAMPQRWFAYQPVDLMVLATGNADFVNALVNDKPRINALREWILRGGRIVISTGRNANLLPELLPALIESAAPEPLARVKVLPGGLSKPRVPGLAEWSGHDKSFPNETDPDEKAPPPLTLANLQIKPDKGVEELAVVGDGDTHPLLLRMPYGMGQVILLACDLDQPAFRTWSGQSDFWKNVQRTMSVRPMDEGNNVSYDTDVAATLAAELGHFPEVSNISFGWVALFIFIYILVVGPLDYLFLKKVVKRLELTWITFPTVVLVVSVVAYFTAYALKGNDLLINKVDVVDIDLEGKVGYGHSWFTLFSPRIQHYTIGLEPGTPTWGTVDDKATTMLLSWDGKPTGGFGIGGSGGQGLFHRTYTYAPDATGLEGVPIQVWTDKSFRATWVRPFAADKPPFVADLKLGTNRNIQGTITSKLPVDLYDVHFLTAGPGSSVQVYPLGKVLVPDNEQRLNLSLRQNRDIREWVNSRPDVIYKPRPGVATTPLARDTILKRILFYQAASDSGQNINLVLRNLDASWRLRLKNEVILYARLAPQIAPAESVMQAPETSSRLWLGDLPAPGKTRPSIAGNITQDIFIRVFIPVQTEENKE